MLFRTLLNLVKPRSCRAPLPQARRPLTERPRLEPLEDRLVPSGSPDLGASGWITDPVGEAPILLLDDVFSELDPDRSDALLHHLPPCQALLSTAGVLPEGAVPELIVRVSGGTVTAA